jgi:Na+-driven multidrug efflux pump
MLLKLSKKLILIGVVIGLILLIIGLLFYDNFGYVFSSDRLVIDKFSEVFWIVLLMQPLCAIAFIFDGIFKGLGWMKELRNVLLFSTFIIFIPTIIIADFYNLKIVGIFIAFTVWVIARGAPLVIKFYKRCVALEQKM